MKTHPIKNYRNTLKGRIRESKPVFILLTILRILTVVAMVRSIIIGNYGNAFTAFLVLLLFLVPSFLEGALRLRIPPLFEAIIYCFIFAANILGEIYHFYAHIPIWDTALHTLNGFLFAAVGFSTVELLNRNSKKFNLSPLYLTLVAFCVSMTVGVLWEFFECGMDLFFNMDMQKDFIVDRINSTQLDPAHDQTVIHVTDIINTKITTASGEVYNVENGYIDIGILDSMKDLLVNLIGAVVFCIFGFIYTKFGKKTKTAAKIVEGLKIQPDTVTPAEAEAAEETAEADKTEDKEETKENKE